MCAYGWEATVFLPVGFDARASLNFYRIFPTVHPKKWMDGVVSGRRRIASQKAISVSNPRILVSLGRVLWTVGTCTGRSVAFNLGLILL